MAQNKGMLQTMTKILESQSRQTRILVTKVNDMQEQVKTIQPQTYLHPIPKPRQGKEFSRSTSVAGWLFEAIEGLNEEILEGNRKYLQFPSDIDFRRLNMDCIRELEGLMSFHIPDLCGKVTWEEACRRPKECEKIIREARVLPELAVFAQAAGQWALRTLCANKMRTLLATNMKKKQGKRKIREETNELSIAEDDLNEVDKVQAESHIEELTLQGEIAVSDEQDEESVKICDAEDDALGSQEPDRTRQFESKEQSGESGIANDMDDDLSEDFPPIEEEDTVMTHPEMESDRANPRSKDSASVSSSETASPAMVQVAAQRAASRVLSAVEETSYRHKSVFNDSHHPDPAGVQHQVPGSESILSSRNRNNLIHNDVPRAKISGKTTKAAQKCGGTFGVRKVRNGKDLIGSRLREVLNTEKKRNKLSQGQPRKQPYKSTTANLTTNEMRTVSRVGHSTSSCFPNRAHQKGVPTAGEKRVERRKDPTKKSNATLKRVPPRSTVITKNASDASNQHHADLVQAAHIRKVRTQNVRGKGKGSSAMVRR